MTWLPPNRLIRNTSPVDSVDMITSNMGAIIKIIIIIIILMNSTIKVDSIPDTVVNTLTMAKSLVNIVILPEFAMI